MCGRLQIPAKPDVALGSGTANQRPTGLLVFLSLKPFQEALPLRSLSPQSGAGLDVSSGLIQLAQGEHGAPQMPASPPQQVPGSAKLGRTSGHARPLPFFPLQSPGGLTLPPFNNSVKGQGRKKPFLSHWVHGLCRGRERWESPLRPSHPPLRTQPP